MGVKGLWSILESTSKTVKIESLAGKVLAVDASIWLYQFVKAMRDSQGNTIHGAHIVGFLRRICKLLFNGIKPVFVFDGAAPELKKATIAARQLKSSRAEYSLQKTAEKLLEARMRVRALESIADDIKVDAQMDETKDEYQLPNEKAIDGNKLDPRLATENEIRTFMAKRSNEIDFSLVDINSIEFQSLPIELQHEVILDLKNKSRKPSQSRVEQMLENSETALDFSNQQIKNVIHRATLTERYHDTLQDKKRVVGTRQKVFTLKKNLLEDGIIKKPERKVVVDLNGLDGFHRERERTINSVPTSDVDHKIFTENKNHEDDPFPLQEVLAKINQDQHDGIQKSKLSLYLDLEKEIDNFADSLPMDNPLFWAESWEANAPTCFKVIYPHFKQIFTRDILLNSDSSLKDLVLILNKRIDNSSDEEEVKAHSYYLQFIESAIHRKEMILRNFEPAETTLLESANEVPITGKVKKGFIFESDSEVELSSILEEELPSRKHSSMHDPLPHDDLFKSNLFNEDELNCHCDSNDITNMESAKSETKEDIILIDSGNESEFSNESEIEWMSPDDSKMINSQARSTKLSDETNLEESMEDIDVQSVYNEELDTLIQDLEVQDFSKALEDARSEVIQINASHIRNMRDAGGVTTQMVTEVQELLSLFGIPYVVAPMEAESQCAYFQIQKMIDGIITDDSDVFLFGGDVVYKNMYDNKKFVQRYTMSEMNDEMGITRIELIQMAYLLGSDYTIGVKGIGPVSSIEIVTTWQSETLAGLSLFKNWVADLQKGIVGDIEGRALNGLIATCKNIKFQENFPDPRIMNAYLDPVVDESKEIFTWGKPQLEQLTLYLKNKLGWEKEKINDIIVPVMKGMQDKRQTTIESFFPFLPKKSKSKRVLNATRGGRKRQRSGD